jgi:hypothetical protein
MQRRASKEERANYETIIGSTSCDQLQQQQQQQQQRTSSLHPITTIILSLATIISLWH